MPKLRKMLGDIASPECTGLMRMIETQSRKTLCAWAAGYAHRFYLPIYEACCPQDTRLGELLRRCADYESSGEKSAAFRPAIREAGEIARAVENSTAQAAARAVSTACGVVTTPTNALGYLFYGAFLVRKRRRAE